MKSSLLLLFCLYTLLAFGQATSNSEPDTALARLLLDQADTLALKTIQYAQVERLCDSAAALLNRQPPPGEWLLSRAIYRKASNYVAQRNGKAALPLMEESLQIRTRLFGENHPAVGECWLGLGSTFYLLSKPADSREAAEKALRIFTEAYGENHLMVARCYNTLANAAYGDFEAATTHLWKALEILENIGQGTIPDAARSYHLLGNQSLGAGKNEDAIRYTQKAVAVYAANGMGNFPAAGTCLLIQGIARANLDYTSQALQSLEQARAIFLENFGELNPLTATSWLKTGEALHDAGDLGNALPYFHRALAIMQKLGNTSPEILANIYIALGAGYHADGDFPKAAYYFHQTLEVEKTYKQFEIGSPVTMGNLSATLFEMGDFTNAEFYSKAALEYYIRHPDEPFYTPAMETQLRLDSRKKDFSPSKKYIANLIENLYLKTDPGFRTHLAELHSMTGRIFIYENQWDAALASLDNALQNIPDTTVSTATQSNIHGNKGLCYLSRFRQKGLQEDLDSAYQAFKMGREKSVLKSASLDSESKIYWSGAFFFLHEGLIETCLNFYRRSSNPAWLQEAFLASESAKAEVLREGVAHQTALKIAGIPDSLPQREANLKADIANLQSRIFQSSQSPDSNYLHEWQGQIVDKKQALQALLRSLETDYPDYYRLKYNPTLAGASDLRDRPEGSGQALLDSQTALLEYFLGDSSIFIFTLTKQALYLDRLPKPKDFDTTLENLRKALTDSGYRAAEIDMDSFVEASTKLYDWLLVAPVARLPPAVKNLIIVPDGALGYLPFDLLGKPSQSQTGTSADFKTFDYLLRHYNVSYAYSANLLLEQTQRAAQVSGDLALFAGFAPVYENNDTLDIPSHSRGELVRNGKYDLPGARQEVQQIAELLGGQSFLAEAASEHNFKQNSQRFRILHLAMHTVLEDRNPMFSKLLFTQTAKDGEEDNDLNASELYAMRLPAELTVLSACETGIGKVRRGEGILSLSRAFTYAGVPATVMSLWRADDETTRQVMVSFYENLKRGLRKDEALREAKLSYLENCEAKNASPFFWAGFVAAGEMAAIFR